ncbi:MAG: type II toxin-antitoxin system VapC family toxin [Kiloniellales bacterium]|nr:type II toxin-antitoxin system VapC family toxin [Kiloniellales bacterium]
MVVDTSAILAILLQEDDAHRFAEAIEAVERPLISAANVVESGIVLMARYGAEARADLEALLEAGGMAVEPVTVEQGTIALDAYEAFGKGRGHGASLNFGDRFAYALAKARGLPLLFKGEDFSRTDISSAL